MGNADCPVNVIGAHLRGTSATRSVVGIELQSEVRAVERLDELPSMNRPRSINESSEFHGHCRRFTREQSCRAVPRSVVSHTRSMDSPLVE